MKHYFSKTAIVFFLFLCYSSCSTDSANQDPVLLKEVSIDLSQSNLGQPVNIVTYTTKSEMEEKLPESIDLLIDEAIEMINENHAITDITVILNISKGTVRIEEFTSYNNSKIVNAYKLHHKGNHYERIISPLLAKCPEGYNELASCNNFDNPASCVSSVVAAFLSENISSPGDCANVQVSVGTFTTKVCGRTCN